MVAYEKWLIVVQIAYRSDRQRPCLRLAPTRSASGLPTGTARDGTLRTAVATYQPHGSSCLEGGQQSATGGTVTYATITDTLVEGSHDL